ncbi:MAG: AAA family ATPase [Myxococcota bacterium]
MSETLSRDLLRSEPPVVLPRLQAQLREVVIGQDAAIDGALTALLAEGHVLLEGVPGVAKTLLARALAASLGLRFQRVQFTPDLMPTDLLGTRVYDEGHGGWEFHPGPLFTEVLLADEVNRTPPKTQAALLEAMAERQVTLDGERRELGEGFFVIATENPLEFEGTYPLPEAQTDRFLLKVKMGYPSEEAEWQLLNADAHAPKERLERIAPLLDLAGLQALRRQVRAVHIEESVKRYAHQIVLATRRCSSLRLGASPRAGIMLLSAARATAVLAGRTFVLPDDVKGVAPLVLEHRLVLSPEAELDGEDLGRVVHRLLDEVPVVR